MNLKKNLQKTRESSKNPRIESKTFKERIAVFNRIPNKLLTFDLTNVCNLSCFYCTFTQNSDHKNKSKQPMSVENISKICGEFLENGSFFENIALSVSGEPTLNPSFDSIIEYLYKTNTEKKRLFRYISINTNATALNKKRVNLINDWLLRDCGGMQLTLSINAGSRESFLKSKKVDLYEKTIENVRYLLEEKARRKIEYQQTVYLQFLINEMVEHEAEIFRDFWSTELRRIGLPFKIDYALPIEGAHVVIIFKRTYAEIEWQKGNRFPKTQRQYDEMHRKVIERLGLKPVNKEEDQQKHIPVFHGKAEKVCGSPFISPIIRRDGTLNLCLVDVLNYMKLGNVFEESFFKLWLSPEVEQLRARLIRREFLNRDLCKNCNYFDGVSIPAEIREEYVLPVPKKKSTKPKSSSPVDQVI